ncbi:hypothetical protein E1B28_003028 [Marasmius oreades]|uniref:F-box domain-containing protein n=1 Tax=Marasmius oreades TaxID=181124 RepID=A0A9P7RKU4_9AGAR|nr:uncharacterized protein E1B28_003028 [Marasmius oreades]KAG7085467.1 hypothetical protein E1B28_003028 [Marasmius oreades]
MQSATPQLPVQTQFQVGGQQQGPEPADDEDSDAALQLLVAQRRKRRRCAQTVLSSESEKQDDPNYAPSKPKYPRRKKRKTSDSEPWRLGFLELPVDVFLEIAKELTPPDLLNLSRTNKSLRNHLMSRQNHVLWRESLANIPDLPALPPGMTEPSYVNLLFSTKCHLCSSGHSSPYWECRLRCCTKCINEAFIEKAILMADGQFSFLASNADLLKVIPQRAPGIYLRSAVENFCFELDEVVGNEEQFSMWHKAKIDEHSALVEHAKQCQKWAKSQNDKKKAERAAIRARRLEQAKERLSKLGWGKEMENTDFLKHPFFRQNKEFDEGAWERAKDGLIERLNKIKDEAQGIIADIRVQRCNVIQDTYNDLRSRNPLSILPSLGDLLSCRLINDLLERRPFNKLTTADVSSVLNLTSPSFSLLVEKWRAAKDLQLFQILRKANPSILTPSEFNLATTVFRCNDADCGQPLQYPDVLIHPCTSSPAFRFSKDMGGTPSRFTSSETCRKVGSDPWNLGGNRISFHEDASANARAIVNACGLDPKEATVSEMNMKNPVIECRTCREVLRWPQVLGHLHKGKFTVCKSQDEEIRQEKPPARVRLGAPWVFGVRCARCGYLCAPQSLPEHLAKEHGLIEPSNMDWCFDTEAKFDTAGVRQERVNDDLSTAYPPLNH